MPGKVSLSSDASVAAAASVNPAKRKAAIASAPTQKRFRTTENRPSRPNSPSRGDDSSDSTTNEHSVNTSIAIDSAVIGGGIAPALDTTDVSSPTATPPTPILPFATPKRSRSTSNKTTGKNPNIREKRLRCTYEGCDKAFARPCRLDEHIRSHTGERPFKCTLDPENCTKSFLRESHLKAHIKAIHEKAKTYRCTFQLPIGVEENLGEFGFKRKASEPPDAEDDGKHGHRECGAKFTTNQHLKRHMESHEKTFPHICKDYPPCAAGFRKKGPLTRHVRSEHLKLPPWACTHPDIKDPSKKCEAAFDNRGKLGNHVQMVHTGLAKKRYVCAICTTWKSPTEPDSAATGATVEASSSTAIPTDIKSSVETSTTIKQEPDTAESDASLLLSLSQPSVLIPSTPFPIISAPVPRPRDASVLRAEGIDGFITHSELRAHISEAHPPICGTCGFVAKRARDLKTHVKEKHEESVDERRIWMCEWEGCFQDFTQKRNLRAHTRLVHQNLKPYPCPHAPECTERFAYRVVLDRHLLKAHSTTTNSDPAAITDSQPTSSSTKKTPTKTRKKNTLNRRRRRTKEQDLLQKLTGIGYDDTGRNWTCPVEGCEWRAYRKWDLAVHLKAEKGHGMSEVEAAGLLGVVDDAEKGDAEVNGEALERLEERMEIDEDAETTEGSESDWSAGSESDEEAEEDGDMDMNV